MIATFFHIFLWMTTTLATNKKILTKTQTQTHEMLSTPLPFPYPPPIIILLMQRCSDNWVRKECKKLSEASRPRNLLIWNHSRTSCRANNIKVDRVITWTARRLVVCLFVCLFAILVSCTCEKCKCFQRALQAQWPDIFAFTSLLVLQASYDLWAILLSICHIRLPWIFSKPVRMLTIVQCWPTTRRLCCTKTWVKLQGKQPHQPTSTHQCTMKDEWYVMRKQFSVGLQFPS